MDSDDEVVQPSSSSNSSSTSESPRGSEQRSWWDDSSEGEGYSSDSDVNLGSCHRSSEERNDPGSSPTLWNMSAYLECLIKRKPEPTTMFFAVKDLAQRQLGLSENLRQKFYGSVSTVGRLELLHTMNKHEGCVNYVEFHRNGELLVSGSDDLTVCISNWSTGKIIKSYDSGHRNNIFQASWLPGCSSTMVTCASDGQVRFLDLPSGLNRKVAKHQGACNRMAIHLEHPDCVLSVGDDGKILNIDRRSPDPTKLITMRNRSVRLQMFTIDANPRNQNEFCVGGRPVYVYIFDRRKTSKPLTKMVPDKLRPRRRPCVTSVAYNYDGSEILASYNDDDIYMFDNLKPHPIGDYTHRYTGHRNSKTIKGVNYFGLKSEFIVSGSDCGNIFFWEKNSETVVQCIDGDHRGVVNCIKPHPTLPILASSGLDDDVKIWMPGESDCNPEFQKIIESNLTGRAEARALGPHVETTADRLNLHMQRYFGTRAMREMFARPTADPNINASGIYVVGGHADDDADDDADDNNYNNADNNYYDDG